MCYDHGPLSPQRLPKNVLGNGMEAGGQEGGRTLVVCNLFQIVDWDIFGMDPSSGLPGT